MLENTLIFLIALVIGALLSWIFFYRKREEFLAKKEGRRTKDFDIVKKKEEEETDPRKKYLKAAKNVITPGQEKLIKGMMGITLSRHRKKEKDS